jgi:hypothetical protein
MIRTGVPFRAAPRINNANRQNFPGELKNFFDFAPRGFGAEAKSAE